MRTRSIGIVLLLLLVASRPSAAAPAQQPAWRPATREGAELFRQAKHERRPVVRSAALALLSSAASVLRKHRGLDAAFKARHLIDDAVHLAGPLSVKEQRQVNGLLRLTGQSLLRNAAAESYPGDVLYVARTVLELPVRPTDHERASELAAKALVSVLDDFVRHTELRQPSSIAAFRDDRVKDGQAIRGLAQLTLDLPKELAGQVKRAQKRALDLLDSPQFERFVAEGALRSPSPLSSARPPRTVEDLKGLLALPLNSLDDVHRLERLLARSSVKVTAAQRSALQGSLTGVALQAARRAAEEARFRAHYVDGPEGTSRYLKSRIADRYVAVLKRLDSRLAALGASVEARRALHRGATQLGALGQLLDPGLYADRLQQREIKKDLQNRSAY